MSIFRLTKQHPQGKALRECRGQREHSPVSNKTEGSVLILEKRCGTVRSSRSCQGKHSVKQHTEKSSRGDGWPRGPVSGGIQDTVTALRLFFKAVPRLFLKKKNLHSRFLKTNKQQQKPTCIWKSQKANWVPLETTFIIHVNFYSPLWWYLCSISHKSIHLN